MDKYLPTIGLEIHAELNTKTKMFCSCKNDPDEEKPNVNICPVCLGHPGTLPVINKEAVKSILKVGLSVGGELADDSEFDRKNYFYPDIPKGYQISQYKLPLVSGGELGGVKLTRIHLEEDTGKSSHEGDHSLVDFNRAGVPLMELVTEPVIHSSAEAVKFGKELQLLLQYLGVAEANMEKGEMRFEANISVSKVGDKGLGTKVEVKNLNSFKAAEKAIEYEIKRHINLVEGGGKVTQETRGWNDAKEETYSQRSKEDSHDYRYFPDPDLPKLKISEVADLSRGELSSGLGETPAIKRQRFLDEYKLRLSDVEFYINNKKHGDLFEEAAKLSSKNDFQLLSNYIVSDLGSVSDFQNITAKSLSELIGMTSGGEISSRGAKDILNIMLTEGGEPKRTAERHGLFQKTDKGELEAIVKGVIENNKEVVDQFKSGKESALEFLVGQSMKASKGAGNPSIIRQILKELL